MELGYSLVRWMQFPVDVGFFSDIKTRALNVKYGCKGIAAYVRILCAVYHDGYYIALDDDLVFAVAEDTRTSENFIREVIRFLAERSMLDSTLLRTEGVLTSLEIQQNYQEIVRRRGERRTVEVERRYWLLKDEETAAYISLCPNEVLRSENGVSVYANGGFGAQKPTKESREKERRGDLEERETESAVGGGETRPQENGLAREREPSGKGDGGIDGSYGLHGNVRLRSEEYESLKEAYVDYEAKIDRLSEYMKETGKRYASHYHVICRWAKEDAERGGGSEQKASGESSFELQEFYEAAVRRSYEGKSMKGCQVKGKGFAGELCLSEPCLSEGESSGRWKQVRDEHEGVR